MITEKKNTIRIQIRRAIRKICPQELKSSENRIHAFFLALPEYKNAKIIHTYISSFFWEVDTFRLIYRFFQDNKKVIVPITEACTLELHHGELTNLNNLSKSPLGIWEPSDINNNFLNPLTTELIIVPGLAFDQQGHRLGSGKGYYDRFLSQMQVPKVGLVHPVQFSEKLPTFDSDVALDILVLPDRIIRCS